MGPDAKDNELQSERLQGPDTLNQLLANEIIAKRTAWFFHGICARGTNFPDGTISKDSAADVTAGGSQENQIRYADTALRYSPKVPLLYYACHIFSAARLRNSDHNLIVLSRVPSEIPGIDEVVINGHSGTVDTRSDKVEYSLIQRIDSSSSQKLFDLIKEAPGFFERFYQTAFPGLDSAKDDSNGLYRFLASELILIEPPQLEAFAKGHPAKQSWRNDGTFENPVFDDQEALELLNQGSKVKLDSPVGVGTAQDFLPVKAKIRAEWDEAHKKILAQRSKNK